MTRILLASAAALALISSGAVAQTQIIEKKTIIQPETLAPVPAPGATVTESTRSKTYNSDGSETRTRETVRQNSSGGVSATSRSRTITPDGSVSTTTKDSVKPGDGSSSESTTTTTIER